MAKIMFEAPSIAEAMRAHGWKTAPVPAICLDANHGVAGADAQTRRVVKISAEQLAVPRPPEPDHDPGKQS
jgi:hypothetical protein